MAVSDDFTASELDLNDQVSISSPTALVWGPDGRLYVTEVDGDVKVLTVAFGDPDPSDDDPTAKFYVTDAETLGLVKSIPNYNDDGTLNGGSKRQVTGIDVTPQLDASGNVVTIDGKPAVNIYVTSSDSRIGAGGSGADKNLDTNSGTITRLSQTETGWDAVDLVRGLARSEENHATNGLEVIQEVVGGQLVERIIVANGGNANTGAPSNNFAGQQEQPFSAAILEVDLTELNGMTVKTDPSSGRSYIYDLPTLDDPTRSDASDPFGGNDGFNSAILTADGPVQIYSAGYRNAYDVEVTEDGRVWTYDNGANNNWGGRPAGEDSDGDTNATESAELAGPPAGYIATNMFVEDNDEPAGNFNPQNWDQLHEVTRSDDLGGRTLSVGLGGAQTYQWDHPDHGTLTLVYGGHPNPTRAEGARAGLLYSPEGGVKDSRLLVSNAPKDDGADGTTSDFLEVIAWLEGLGYSDAELDRRVLAVEPGKTYADPGDDNTMITVVIGEDGNGDEITEQQPNPDYWEPDPRPTAPGIYSLAEDPNGPVGLPADIDAIVHALNPIEGDYREAGYTDGAIDTGKGSINGLAEYTSTIFEDAGQTGMLGALFAASLNQGQYYVIGRDGQGVVQTGTDGGRTIAADRDFVASGGAPLGVASIGDDLAPHENQAAFRGTVWGAIYKQNGPVIEVLQPGNPGDNALLGVANYAGQEPADPTDNDLDGVDHLSDPFEFDADNGLALSVGETIELNFSQVDLAAQPDFSGTIGDTGLMGAALDGSTPNRDAITGLYPDGVNGDGAPAAEQQDGLFDNAGNIIPGGNAPLLQVKTVRDGSAVGGANDARDLLHTGVRLDPDVKAVVAEIEIRNWYADQKGEGRVTGLSIGDGTQSNFLRFVFGDVDGVTGDMGLQVLVETGDVPVVLATVEDAAFAAALAGGSLGTEVTLQLEISEIGESYAIGARYKVDGGAFTEVPLDAQLPAGVLRDVLDGTHTITSGGPSLSSGAAVGIVAEKDDGAAFDSVDIDVIRIRGEANRIEATSAAEVAEPGTTGEDTVVYVGDDTALALAGDVENFDGSGSNAAWNLTANDLDNDVTVGAAANTITTGGGADVVRGSLAALDGDVVTDFSEDDTLVVTDATVADMAGASYEAGSAIITLNGATFELAGEALADFDPADPGARLNFADGPAGLEITVAPDEAILYRVNAGSDNTQAGTAGTGTIAALDGGPDWIGDAGLIGGTGAVTVTGNTGDTYSNAATNAANEVDFDNVDGAVVPWQLFVNERSDNNSGGEKLIYNFEVQAGTSYRIELFYTENWTGIFGSNADRVFDVEVEGQVPAAFDDIHPLAEAEAFVGDPAPTTNGASNAGDFLGVARKAEHVYTATDDLLTLEFNHGTQNPKVNAIQITQLGGTPVGDVTAPVVTDIVVETPTDNDSPLQVTVSLSDETGFAAVDFADLDGSELNFSGIAPESVTIDTASDVSLSGDGRVATLVYTITPPAGTGAWPTGDFAVAAAPGAFADAAGNESGAALFDFAFAAPVQPGDVVLAVNAGGGSVDGAAYGLPGVTFEADQGGAPHPTVDFSNSTSGNKTNSNGNDDTFTGADLPDTVFVTERWGNDFSYDVDLPNGTYLVDLYFAETFIGTNNLNGGIGSRIFDAEIEGTTVLDDYDLYDDSNGVQGDGVGAPSVKIVKTFEATVTDGQLNIAFDAKGSDGEDNAKISAFVVRVPGGEATLSVAGPGTIVEDGDGADQTVAFTVTASDGLTGDLNLTYTLDGGTTSVAAPVSFAAGTGTILVPVATDTAWNGDETVTLTLLSVAEAGYAPAAAASATATITEDEVPDSFDADGDGPDAPVVLGDLSEDNSDPTDLTLSAGSNVVVSSQQGANEPGGRDYDYYTIVVPEGHELTAINVTQYTGDISNQAFVGLIAGDTFPAPPASDAEFPGLASQLLGGALVNAAGANLLPEMADGEVFGQTTQGFTGPLGAGTYTIWHSQNGGAQTTGLDFVVTPVGDVVTIGIADADPVVEADGATLDFTLTASDPAFAGEVTVSFDTEDAAGQSQLVTFAAGEATLSLPVTNDTVDDDDDQVSVTLTGATSADATLAIGAAASATGVVIEDDGPATLPKGDFVFGINAGGPAVTIDGNLFEASEESSSNEWGSETDFGSSNGTDYTGDGLDTDADTPYETEFYAGKDADDPLTFTRGGLAPGDYVLTLKFAEIFASSAGARVFDVTVNGEVAVADLDIFAAAGGQNVAYDVDVPVTIGADGVLSLEFDPSADNAKVSAIALYAAPGDPDAAQVSVGDIVVDEDAGVATVTFTRTGADDEAISVSYATADGTALAGADYEATSGTAVIAAGGTGQVSVDITLLGDTLDEGDEAFTVMIADATATSNAVTLGQATATVTLTDNDAPLAPVGRGPDDDLDQDGTLNADDDDVDGDTVANGDETFSYDATNAGTALAAGQVVTFDFETAGTPFEAGFTGALLSPSKPAPEVDLSNADVSGGTLNVTATGGDHFGGNNTQANAFVAAYTAPAGLSVETRYAIPDYDPGTDGDQAPVDYQSAGVVIGTDQNNLVKLVYGRGDAEFELVQDNAGGNAETTGAGTTPAGAAEVATRLEVRLEDGVPVAEGFYTFYDAGGAVIGTPDQSAGTITLINNATTGLASLVTTGAPLGAGVIQTSTGPGPVFDVAYQYLTVEALGDAPANVAPSVALGAAIEGIAEDADTSLGTTFVAEIVVTDDGVGTNALSLSGADAALFTIVDGISGPELHLAQGAVLDVAANPTLDVTVEVDDADVGATPDDVAALALPVTEPAVTNLPPTGVSLANRVTRLASDADLSAGVKVADIVVADDGVGTNAITVTGDDAALFEVVGTELRLVPGADLSGASSLSVSVAVDDAEVGATPDATVPFALEIAATTARTQSAASPAELAAATGSDDEDLVEYTGDAEVTGYTLPGAVENFDATGTGRVEVAGNAGDNVIGVGLGAGDAVDLSAGGNDTVAGTGAELDGTIITGLDAGDSVLIEDESVAGLTLTEGSVMAETPGGTQVIFADLPFGDTSVGDFQLIPEGGGTRIVYAPGDDPVAETVRIQAEDFDTIGAPYAVQPVATADAGQLIALPLGAAGGSVSHALSDLVPGTYNLRVAYFDENDGQSTASVTVGDRTESWVWDDDANSGGSTQAGNIRVRTIEGVEVDAGSTITLSLDKDDAELGRFDYVEFVPAGGDDGANRAPFAPFGVPEQAASEDAAYSLDLTGIFVDPEEAPLSFALVSGPGWLTLQNGVLSGTPGEGDGDAAVEITVSDGVNVVPVAFDIAVAAGNDAPTTDGIPTQSATEGADFNLDLDTFFTDLDSDVLSYAATGLPAGVTLTDGVLSGTPTGGGSYPVTVTASDGVAETSTQFLINVVGTDDRPQVTIEAEDFTLVSGFFVDGDSDASGGAHLQTLPGAAAEATYAVGDAVAPGAYSVRITYFDENDGTSDARFELSQDGGATFAEVGSWQFDDNSGGSAAQAQNLRGITFGGLTVGPDTVLKLAGTADSQEYLRFDKVELLPAGGGANFAPSPVGIDDVVQDSLDPVAIGLAGAFDDPEEDPLSYAVTSGQDWLSVVNGVLVGTPPDFGTYEVTVSATDGPDASGVTTTTSFTLSVVDDNTPPSVLIAPTGPITVAEGASLETTPVIFEDLEDGVALGYSLEGAPDWLAISDEGILTGTPGADDVGQVTFEIVGTDSGGLTARQQVTIDVTDENNPPVASDIADQALAGGAAIAFSVADAFSDADPGDTLSYTATLANGDPLPDWLTFDGATGTFGGTALAGQSLSITVTATDGALASDSTTFALNVGAAPDDRTAIALEVEDFALGGAFVTEGSTSASGNALAKVGPNGATGTATATLAGTGASGLYAATVRFYDENDGVSDAILRVDGQVVGTWSFDAPNQPENAGQAANIREVTFDGVALSEASQIEIEVTSGTGEHGRIDLITFAPVANPAPVISTTALSVAENEVAAGTVAAAGAGLSFAITGGADAALFTIDAGTGALSFAAAPDFEAPGDAAPADNVYEVEVTATNDLGSDSATIAVTVGDVDEAPELSVADVTVAEGETAAGQAAAVDPEGQAVVYSLEPGVGDNDLFTIEPATGALAFAAAPDADAPADADGDNVYDVTVSASDGVNVTTAPLTVTVTDDGTVDPDIVARINAFGPTVAATDDGPDWSGDTEGDPSPFLTTSQNRGDAPTAGYTGSTAAIPADVPEAVLDTARSSDASFFYDIPVTDGTYEVRFYVAELFSGGQGGGFRIFDFSVEGQVPQQLDNVDPGTAFGADVGVLTAQATVTDGILNLGVLKDTVGGQQNPIVNAIEVVRIAGITDETGPTAAITLTNPSEADGTLGVAVALSDPSGVDASTLGPEDLQIAVDGTVVDAAVTFAGFADGVATYEVAAPAGGWTDAAQLEVTLLADAVADLAGTPNGNVEVSQSATLDIGGGQTGGDDVLLRINAFGPAVASIDDGPDWQADGQGTANSPYLDLDSTDPAQDRGDVQGYSGDAAAIPEGVPEAVLNTARSSNDGFSYDIPAGDLLGAGNYTVTLHLAELFPGNQTVGERVFDVIIEGQSFGVLDDFDPSAGVGAGDARTISFDVAVTDGELNIEFEQDTVNGNDNPIVNGIEVSRFDGTIDDPPGGGGTPGTAGEILGGLTEVDADGDYGSGTTGSARLAIMEGNNSVQSSNFGSNSFQLENTGGKQIAAVFLDFRGAIYPDSIVDFDGSAGDTAAKEFGAQSGVNSTGVITEFVSGQAPDGFALDESYFLAGDTPDPAGGDGATGGWRGLLIRFDGTDGGFANGETLGFAGDMDPNSIAAISKGDVDSGAVNGWDVGGISGAELIGSSFTVLFDDGSQATGYLGSDGSQAGSVGVASQAGPAQTASVSVNGASAAGTYGGTPPVIEVDGPANATVLVTMSKGLNPVTNNAGGVADLVADRLDNSQPFFPVNNAADFQTFEVTLDGSGKATLPADAFDYNAPGGGQTFGGTAYTPGFETAPMVIAASVVGNDGAPLGPVDRVYLTNPMSTPVEPGDTGGGGGGGTPDQIWLAQGGDVVMEAERADRSGTSGWVFETVAEGSNETPDPQGEGYIIWEGGNSFGNPAANSTLDFAFLTDESGNYTLKGMFGRRVDPNSTEANDVFVRLVTEDGTPVDPVPQPTGGGFALHVKTGEVVETDSLDNIPGGDRVVLNNSQKWMKFYASGLGLDELDGGGQNGDNGGINVTYALDANTVYRLQIAGRSDDFEIDRLALSNSGAGAATSLAETGAESPIQPTGDTAPTVVDPIDDASVAAGQGFTIDASGAFQDLDGDVLDYALGLNEAGASIDPSGQVTVGAGLAPGSYAIEVIASDEDGNDVSDTFTLTVTDPAAGPVASYAVLVDGATFDGDLQDGDSYAAADLGGSVEFTGLISDGFDGSTLITLRSGGVEVASVVENFSPWDLTVASAALTPGSYTLEVELFTGENAGGSSLGTQSFDFAVTGGGTANVPPSVADPIADVTIGAGTGTVIDTAGTFEDTDGDTLSLTATIPGAAQGFVSFSGGVFTVSDAATAGTYTLGVTADDGAGGQVSDSFDLIVTGGGTGPAAAITVLEGGTVVDDLLTGGETYGLSQVDGSVLFSGVYPGDAVGSVDLTLLSGGVEVGAKLENNSPYDLTIGGGLSAGDYELVVDAYQGDNLSGGLIGSETFTFSVADDDTGGGGDPGGGDGGTGGGGSPGSLVRAIATSTDDWEMSGQNASGDLEFGRSTIGMRFTNIDIPDGAVVTSASIALTAQRDSGGAASFTISIEDDAFATTYGKGNSTPIARSYLDDGFAWSPGAWSDGQLYETPDLAGLINDLVGTGGLTNGALGFAVEGSGLRRADSFDAAGDDGPVLTIEYDFV